LPINACNAESEGFIDYTMEESLKNHLQALNNQRNVVTLLTMEEGDKDNKAFDNATKPSGVFFDEIDTKRVEKPHRFVMVEDAGRGYRRVVPSPEPLVIHGVNQIKALIDQAIVISSGGGGIPVYRDENGNIQGVEAVIDKDRSG